MTTPRSREPALAPPSGSPDCLQAQHLREMLLAQCEDLDATLANFGAALERYQHRGEQAQARRVRGLIRSAERERRAAHLMIAKLEQRFLGAGPQRSEPRPAVATARPLSRVHPYPTPHRVIRA